MQSIDSHKIISELKSLSDNQKSQVYEFIEFIKYKHIRNKATAKQIIEETYGFTKGSKLTSEIFAKMKNGEIALENHGE